MKYQQNRVNKSANKMFHWIAGVSAALKSVDLTTFITTNKFTGSSCNPVNLTLCSLKKQET